MTRTGIFALAAWCCLGMPALPLPADEIQLTGTVRDLKRGDWDGGHPDFQTAGAMGHFGHVLGLVSMDLGEDGKPVYNPQRPNKDTIESADSLYDWYNDVPDVNVSAPLVLTLDNGQTDPGGTYTYHDSSFWPIDGEMLGNQSLNRNFHFTFELHTEFTYKPGQYFTFIGDDDVWVYVDGKQVIDIGGVHPAVTGGVLLFDGKAFVEPNHFTVGGIVKGVGDKLAVNLAKRWGRLNLPGTCPISAGDPYLALNLNVKKVDVICEFSPEEVTVLAGKKIKKVTLRFNDFAEQVFDVNTFEQTFSGSGEHASKQIVGCWVKAGIKWDEAEKGQWFASNGSTEKVAALDFFFAERHTTQSNFRIDTSIQLQAMPPATVSPLYD